MRRRRGAPESRGSSCPLRRTRTRTRSQCWRRRGTRRGAALGRSIRSVPRPPRPPPCDPAAAAAARFLQDPARMPPAPRPVATPLRHLPGCPWARRAPRGLRRLPSFVIRHGGERSSEPGAAGTSRRSPTAPTGRDHPTARCIPVRDGRSGTSARSAAPADHGPPRGGHAGLRAEVGVRESRRHPGAARPALPLPGPPGQDSASRPAPPRPREALGQPRAQPGWRHGAGQAGALPQPPRPGSALSWPRSLGRVVPAALGHSAARSPTPETRMLLRDRRGSSGTVRRRYRQSWALVGIGFPEQKINRSIMGVEQQN